MADRAVYLRLTPQQVGEVMRKASGDGAVNVASLLAGPGSDWELPPREVLQERSRQADETRFSMLLTRGLLILAQLMDGEPASVTDIAAELGMEPSTAHRLINTLQTLGLVEHDPGTGMYRIGR